MGKSFTFVSWQACPVQASASVAVVMGDFNCKSICASNKPHEGGEADERTMCPTVLLSASGSEAHIMSHCASI
jgi:hypothetical protein